MPQYDTPLVIEQIAGYVGSNPEVKEGKRGDFIIFRIGVNESYGDDGTKWYGCTVFDELVQAFVKSNVRKGTPVVLEGTVSQNEYDGKSFNNFNVFRVGLVEWFVKGRANQATDREEEDF